MTALVCPDCGHGDFTADHPATVRRTYTFDASYGADHHDEEVIDVDRDCDEWTCDDCGNVVYGADDLVTEAEYAEAEGL